MNLDLSMDGVLSFVIATAAVVALSTLLILAAFVVYKIVRGEIDISGILSVSQDASMSRFQFLIFTFTISLCYLMVLLYQLVHACDAEGARALCNISRIRLPDGSGAALLLGISGGSYALGKGIQTSGDTLTKTAAARAAADAATRAATAAGAPAAAAATVSASGGGPGVQATVGVEGGDT
jgi:hypothetical protein